MPWSYDKTLRIAEALLVQLIPYGLTWSRQRKRKVESNVRDTQRLQARIQVLQALPKPIAQRLLRTREARRRPVQTRPRLQPAPAQQEARPLALEPRQAAVDIQSSPQMPLLAASVCRPPTRPYRPPVSTALATLSLGRGTTHRSKQLRPPLTSLSAARARVQLGLLPPI